MFGRFHLDLTRALRLLVMLARFILPFLFASALFPARKRTLGVRLRRLIEEMGITYIKLGQFLAMRIDLLPLDICQELGQLFENVPPMKFATARDQIEKELGGPLSDFFADFKQNCVSSASVAQVHQAVGFNGELLAVKIQRPGIDVIFAADIRNLKKLASVADWFHLGGKIPLTEVLKEFADYTTREMDFITEGHTAERLRRDAQRNEYIPKIYWDLTTKHVLTMEYLHGLSLAKVCDLLENNREDLRELLPQLDMTRAAGNLAMVTMRQLFVNGFFHADPHPGNILIRENGVIEFVDFGIFGMVTVEQRRLLSGYIEQLALGNIEASYQYFSRLSVPTEDTDREAYKRDIKDILFRWYEASRNPSAPIEERHLGRYMLETMQLIRRHHLRMSVDTLLFWRALTTLDASAMRLSRELDLLQTMREFFATYRPTMLERLVDAVCNRETIVARLSMMQHSSAQVHALMDNLRHERITLSASVGQSRGGRRFQNMRYRRVALGITAVVVGLIGTQLPEARDSNFAVVIATFIFIAVSMFVSR